jgi:hypothetical protein
VHPATFAGSNGREQTVYVVCRCLPASGKDDGATRPVKVFGDHGLAAAELASQHRPTASCASFVNHLLHLLVTRNGLLYLFVGYLCIYLFNPIVGKGAWACVLAPEAQGTWTWWLLPNLPNVFDAPQSLQCLHETSWFGPLGVFETPASLCFNIVVLLLVLLLPEVAVLLLAAVIAVPTLVVNKMAIRNPILRRLLVLGIAIMVSIVVFVDLERYRLYPCVFVIHPLYASAIPVY